MDKETSELIEKIEGTPMTTEAQIALARKCAAKYWQTGAEEDEATARRILSGEWDDFAYTQAAIAAIGGDRG